MQHPLRHAVRTAGKQQQYRFVETETEASSGQTGEEETTLVYGSADYTRINPAMDEHGEINLLLFNGLTAHDADDNIVPGLAEKWEYDAETCTYTFHIRDGIQWHDGEKFTADDVKFTIEAIMDPENGSENAPNYEDVEEITVIDDSTVSFRLSEPNVAFLEYMTMAILPKHLLEGENMQESDFFRAPVGTGPYKLESWDEGQSIVLVKMKIITLGHQRLTRSFSKLYQMIMHRRCSWNPANWIWRCLTRKCAEFQRKRRFYLLRHDNGRLPRNLI